MIGDFGFFHIEPPFVCRGIGMQSETTVVADLLAGFSANGLAVKAYRDRPANTFNGRRITTIVLPNVRGELSSQGMAISWAPKRVEQ
jgi:hypothetical protein